MKSWVQSVCTRGDGPKPSARQWPADSGGPAMAHLTATEGAPMTLRLFRGFRLDAGDRRVTLPRHARRVVAYLALATSRTNDVDRRLLAERLWPDSMDDKAAASLRTALWRIRREAADLVHTDRERVWLGGDLDIDVHGFQCLAARLLSTDYQPLPLELESLIDAADLLPTWDEGWLTMAREELRQKRLMALESAAVRLTGHGRFVEAIELMLVVVGAEPLRESAHAVVIDAHLQQRNVAAAWSQLMTYARDLWSELGVYPSPELLLTLGVSAGQLSQMLAACANMRESVDDLLTRPHIGVSDHGLHALRGPARATHPAAR